MKCKEIIDILEKLAPVNIAEDYDNVGLLVGDKEKEVKKIMIALDASKDVIKQAIDEKVDMLITHHPMIFRGIKRVDKANFLGDKILELAKNDISYYASHTNMDNSVMSKIACEKLALKDAKYVVPVGVSEDEEKYGCGRVGNLKEPMTLEEFALKVKKDFDIANIRVIGDRKKVVSRVACITGSGKSFLKEVIKSKADVFVTGDIDHHTALDVIDMNFSMIDAGHFETEHFFVDYIKYYLSNNFSDLYIMLAKEKSPFYYL